MIARGGAGGRPGVWVVEGIQVDLLGLGELPWVGTVPHRA